MKKIDQYYNLVLEVEYSRKLYFEKYFLRNKDYENLSLLDD